MSEEIKVVVDGYEMTLFAGPRPDDVPVPMVDDQTLAVRLGYERPRDIKKLIGRLVDKGFLPGIYMRSTVDQLSATVVCGDGSDPAILKEAGAMGADVVLAITPNDQDNLIISQLASLQFGVPRAVALANDPDNAEIFQNLGVSAFSTTHIVGSLIEQRASLEQITNLLPVAEGRVNVTEIILDNGSPVAGKHLKDIELPENSLVAVVIRDNQPIVPRGASQLLAGDLVVLITLPENQSRRRPAILRNASPWRASRWRPWSRRRRRFLGSWSARSSSARSTRMPTA